MLVRVSVVGPFGDPTDTAAEIAGIFFFHNVCPLIVAFQHRLTSDAEKLARLLEKQRLIDVRLIIGR